METLLVVLGVIFFVLLVKSLFPAKTQRGKYVRKMTYCPYCDELISVNAIRCPHCRSDLEDDDEEYEEDECWEDKSEDWEEEVEYERPKPRKKRTRIIRSGYYPEYDAFIDVSDPLPRRKTKK